MTVDSEEASSSFRLDARARLEESERAGLRLAIVLRTAVAGLALAWYVTVNTFWEFDNTYGGLAALLLLTSIGFIHYMVIGTVWDRWWIKYAVTTIDILCICAAYVFVPLTGGEVIPQHLSQRIWGVQLLFPTIALAGLSLSWQLVAWAGTVAAAGWIGVFLILISNMENTLSWADLGIDPTIADYERVFLSVDFIGNGTRVVETFTIVAVAAIVSVTVYRARRVFLAQVRAERKQESERQKRIFASDTLARFVPATIAQRMLDGRAEPPVQERDTAILMLDIESFSTFAAAHEPRQVIESLDEYLSAASEIVADRGGVTISFTGDGLLATFNNPVAVTDPARAALDAAHAIRHQLSNSRFRCRIGLSFGPVVSGRIGSSSRQAFTVYGEAVNIAARLQDHGKTVDATLITDRHFTELDATAWRALGEVELRGMGVPVSAYCL